VGIKGFSGSATRKNERSSGVRSRSVVFAGPFFSPPPPPPPPPPPDPLRVSLSQPLLTPAPNPTLLPRAPHGLVPPLSFSFRFHLDVSSPSRLLPFPSFSASGRSRPFLSRLPHVCSTAGPYDRRLVTPVGRWPRCNHPPPPVPFFFLEFESIKNRLEQRNERPPISHRIMRGPIGPGEKANHGWASRLLLGVKNGPRGALRSLSRGRVP
jgi:hypothetical protein